MAAATDAPFDRDACRAITDTAARDGARRGRAACALDAEERSRGGRGGERLRTWERMSRGLKVPMPLNWHPGPPEFEELDSGDPIARRENWFAALNR